MKTILLALCAFLAVATARVVIRTGGDDTTHLLGAKACTWGPSYWCQNLTTAAGCKATKHCIKSKWENMEVEDDKDSVCDVCKDMVKQARDQLESNQTQEDLKAVFEGSCALMRIKIIVKECDQLVDQFIPELVETLASQMDPSVVCSVSGLCNSARIDNLLREYEEKMTEDDEIVPKSLFNDELEPDECSKCYHIATHLEHKLEDMSRDQILENMLTACGQFSSFSDACSSIVLTHFETIYERLSTEFKAENICHLSGQCSSRFHNHEEIDGEIIEVEVRPLSSVGMVDVSDELPCKLCEQLVAHLRDLLVANTTELEFQKVLEGLCKQTKSFSFECTAIVDEYYPQIYSYLTNELDGTSICQIIGVCPSPDKSVYNGPIWPLLPEKPAAIGVRIMNEKKHNLGENGGGIRKHNLGENGSGLRKQEPKSEAEEMQLPLERMQVSSLAFPVAGGGNAQTCALCEYVLHYLQQVITNPTTEEEVKEEIGKVCRKLPKTVQGNCNQFIDVYGDAIVAILAHEIDPSMLCPTLHLCPTEELINAWDSIPKDMVIVSEVEDKPSCPLCLLAITQLYKVVQNNRTEASIEAALDKLCIHLPKNLKGECLELVKVYSKELVDLLIADLTPQEVCVYIKLCEATQSPVPFIENSIPTDKDGEIMTNEIPDFPLYPVVKQEVSADAECVVCEFIMKQLEQSMKSKHSRDEVEKIVHGVCNILPKTVKRECNDFVNKYADLVIDMLVAEVNPKDICQAISLCGQQIEQMQESVAECALCQSVISAIEKELKDPEVDHDIEIIVSKVCKYIPSGKQSKCESMIEVYGRSIINLLLSFVDTKTICTKLALCSDRDYLAMSAASSRLRRFTNLPNPNLGQKRCTWGTAYWCLSDVNAAECNVVDHCREKVWKANSAPSV
ncbi:prosaposin isoform X2 [Diprion similis]|uniref:prosaposin isoform X2 n=1 Tax=Diprion similis TaxID=362088 RepID=UPI001EF8048C|nr:prosaposin isoform X2 [Diprion similis]